MRTTQADLDRVQRIGSQARDTQTIRDIRSPLTIRCKEWKHWYPLAPEEDMGRSPLSEYMSLSLKLTTNSGSLFEDKMRDIFL